MKFNHWVTGFAVLMCSSLGLASHSEQAIKAAQDYVSKQQAKVVGAYDVGLNDFIVVKVSHQAEGATTMLLVSKDGKLMTNQMFDLSSGQTKPYLRQFEAVLNEPEAAAFLSDFKIDQTITFKKGSGQRELTLLADPNCPYCKTLERDVLAHLDNVTIHVLMFPFLGADSVDKANRIWCAANPQQAWQDWMLSDVVPADLADPDCRYDRRYVDEQTKKMGISGVPVMISHSNNQIIRGGINMETLESLLAWPKGKPRLKGVKEIKFKPF